MRSPPSPPVLASVLILVTGALWLTACGTTAPASRSSAIDAPKPCDSYYVPTKVAPRALVRLLRSISGEGQAIPGATFSLVPKSGKLAICMRLAREHRSADYLAMVMAVPAQLDYLPRSYRVELGVWDHARQQLAMRRRFVLAGSLPRSFTLGRNIGWSDDAPFWVEVRLGSDHDKPADTDVLSLARYSSNPSIREDIHKRARHAQYTVACTEGLVTMPLMDGHSPAYTVTVEVLPPLPSAP